MLPDIPITPVVAKVQSSATDPVHAVLDSSTLNVNVVNTVQNTVPVNVQNQITLPNEYPIITNSSLSVTETNPIQLPSSYPITTSSPIDVNVINQLELPESYPITYTSPLSVKETNPIQLPSKYTINNDYYGNELIHYHSSFNIIDKTFSSTQSYFEINIKSPITKNITSYNQWFFSLSNITLLGSLNDSNKLLEIGIPRNLTNIDYSGFNVDYSSVEPTRYYVGINYLMKLPLISFKGNLTMGNNLLTLVLRKGDYSLTSSLRLGFSVDFYCRARYYPN